MADIISELNGLSDKIQKLSDDATTANADPADMAAQIALITSRINDLTASVILMHAPKGVAVASGEHLQLAAVKNLQINAGNNADNAEILRGTLALYDWAESEMNRRRLEAIVDVQHSLIQRFERGFLLRGVDIQVTLDSNGFAGEGDITLFGELLHRFFALYADIHLFTQLTLILQPTGKCLQWTEHHSQRVPG